jgi:hypothetical protein
MTSADLAKRTYRLQPGAGLVVEWSGRAWGKLLIAMAGFGFLCSALLYFPVFLYGQGSAFDPGVILFSLITVLAFAAGVFCLYLRESLIVTIDMVDYRWRSPFGSSDARAPRNALEEVAVYQSPGDDEHGPTTFVSLRLLGHGLPDSVVVYSRQTRDVTGARGIAREIARHVSVPVNDMGLAPSLAAKRRA